MSLQDDYYDIAHVLNGRVEAAQFERIWEAFCADEARQSADSPVSPSKQAKNAGLKNLTQASQITGVSLQTLTNWHKHKPELFRIVLLGCVAELGA